MIWVFKIFGIPVASIEQWEVVEADEEEEDPAGITGGSSGHFEIDSDPISPEDRYAEWEFGFSPRRP